MYPQRPAQAACSKIRVSLARQHGLAIRCQDPESQVECRRAVCLRPYPPASNPTALLFV